MLMKSGLQSLNTHQRLSLPPPARLTEMHFLGKVLLRPSGRPTQLHCCVCCWKKGRQRVTTTHQCKQCKLPLCALPCHELWECLITGLDYWTGPLDWTTGLDHWTGLLDWPLTKFWPNLTIPTMPLITFTRISSKCSSYKHVYGVLQSTLRLSLENQLHTGAAVATLLGKTQASLQD